MLTEDVTQTEEFDLDFTGTSEAPEASEEAAEPVSASQEASPSVEQGADTSNQVSDPTLGSNFEPKGDILEEATPEEDAESLRKQLADLQAEMLVLKGATSQPQPQPQPQPQEVAPQTSQASPTSAFSNKSSEVSNVDFLGDVEDYTKYFESREALNSLLNRVATVTFNAAITASQERILRQIPAVVETTAKQQQQIAEIVGNFYSSNNDLEPYKPAVSMAAMKLHNDNPSMTLAELLTKAAEETRKTLRIRPGAVARQRVPAQPVGGGRVGGDRASRPTGLSDQEQQMLDLLS